MTDREKLIELLGSTKYGNGSLIGKNFQEGFIAKIADHLLASGVIVLPDNARLILGKNLERIRENISCPQFGDDHYGAWGILRLDQRIIILSMIKTIDYLDRLLQEKFEAEAALKEGQ